MDFFLCYTCSHYFSHCYDIVFDHSNWRKISLIWLVLRSLSRRESCGIRKCDVSTVGQYLPVESGSRKRCEYLAHFLLFIQLRTPVGDGDDIIHIQSGSPLLG